MLTTRHSGTAGTRWGIFVTAICFAILTPPAFGADLAPTELHDRVYFGDETSEREHGVETENAPVIRGGLDRPARVVKKDGKLTFTLSCAPDKPTLVTVRLWGGEMEQTVESVDGQELKINIGHWRLSVDDTRVAQPKRAQLPGRFVYRTIAIPEKRTRGRSEITVTLQPRGGGGYSRGFYAAYTHTQNAFVPPAEEEQGKAPENGAKTLAVPPPEGQKPDFEAIRRNLTEQLDRGIKRNLEKKPYTRLRAGGLGVKYMTAYNLEGSRYHGDQTMITETLAILDEGCRRQMKADHLRYIGGSGQGMMGEPLRPLARAFVNVWPALKAHDEARTTLMQEKIDTDGDGEADMSRKKAYTTLFRDYLYIAFPRVGLRAQSANQDEHNVTAAWYANECLKILSPEDTYPEGLLRSAQRHLWGHKPWDPRLVDFLERLIDERVPSKARIDRRNHDKYLISPGGVSMEWGFSPGYGQHFLRRPPLRDRVVDEQLELYMSAMQHFFVPWRDSDGEFKWVIEGVVGTRGGNLFFWPKVNWLAGTLYAAYHLENPAAERIIRIGLRQANNFADGSLWGSTILRHLPELERVWRRGPTDYRLPVEHRNPYAWIDSTSPVYYGIDPVMIRGEDHILYLQLNQYHMITDRFHSWGSTAFHYIKEDPQRKDYLAHGRFGPYRIAVNQSGSPYYHQFGHPEVYDPPEGLNSAVDLLTGDAVDLTNPMLLQPGDAYIFDTRRTSDGSRTASSRPEVELEKGRRENSRGMKVWTGTLTAPPEGLAPSDTVFLRLPPGEESKQLLKRYRAGNPVLQVDVQSIGNNGRSRVDIAAVDVASRLVAVTGPGVRTSAPTDSEEGKKKVIFRASPRIDLSGKWRFRKGNNSAWKDPNFDDSDWQQVKVPGIWEEHSDYTKDSVYGWYRITGVLPESWKGRPLRLLAGMIDDKDVTYVNGQKVGSTGKYKKKRQYTIPPDVVRFGEKNVIAIRVFDNNHSGGLRKGPLEIYPELSR